MKVLSWETIQKEKQRIRLELDEVEARQSSKRARLKYCLQQIAAPAEGQAARIPQYIYVISALIANERAGGLSRQEVSGLVELAYSILASLEIKPRTSRWASLYGDIHLIRSQIHRKDGEQWRAAWEQNMALSVSGRWPSGGEGFQAMVMGNRALRLGHIDLANQYFADASTQIPVAYRERLRLSQMQAAWLRGDTNKAQQIAEELVVSPELPADLYLEASWHLLREEARQTDDLSLLLSATKRGRPHHHATYLLETCAWVFAHPRREYLARLPSLRHMARNRTLRPQRLGAWYHVLKTLQMCYDEDISREVRVAQLVEQLDHRHELLTIDKELLMLAGAIRRRLRTSSSRKNPL